MPTPAPGYSQGMPSVSTSSHHPQPLSTDSGSCGVDDLERAPVRSKSGRFLNLPSQKARTMAGKAANAARGSTKGATKMASALGRKFRMAGGGSSGQHQAITDASPASMPSMIGREELADSMGIDEMESIDLEADGSWEQCSEDTSSLLYHVQYSAQSTPSTDRPRSPECQDRSDYSSDCAKSGPPSDTHSQGTGSDNEAIGRKAAPQRRELETWDARAFGNCRPLECSSIWDIPTSRVPKPAPQPVLTVREALKEQAGGARSLPKITVSMPDAGRKSAVYPMRQQKGRTAAVVCLSLSLVAAAVFGAMLTLR
jgi:hypothetical protein